MFKFTDFQKEEAVWPSGLGTGREGSRPAPTTELVQMVCPATVGIFKLILFIWNISFFHFKWHAKRIDHYKIQHLT